MKRRIISLLMVCTMSLGLCACDDINADDIIDQVADVVQEDDENVLGVKGGTNDNYPGITYGDAFENFFSSPTWKYFKGTQEGPDDDEDGEPDYVNEDIDVVEFTGRCTYQDVEVKALIQFTLDKEEGTFEPTYLSFNDVPQTTLLLAALIEKAFDSYSDDEQGGEEL